MTTNPDNKFSAVTDEKVLAAYYGAVSAAWQALSDFWDTCGEDVGGYTVMHSSANVLMGPLADEMVDAFERIGELAVARQEASDE